MQQVPADYVRSTRRKGRSRKAGEAVDRQNILSHARNKGKPGLSEFGVHLKHSRVTGAVVLVVIQAKNSESAIMLARLTRRIVLH